MSRLNAIRHGMAGAGDLLGPGENAALVAERSVAFVRDLGVADALGRMLAHRAALLSVRMEAAAERDHVATASRASEARDQFDQDLAAERDAAITALETGDDPRQARADLEATPAGIAHLIAVWRELGESVRAGDQAALDRATRWLDYPAEGPLANLVARLDAELARLDRLASEEDQLRRAEAHARHEAGVLAGFDPSPEANLARRYEAAAERGMFRALRAIADHKRGKSVELGLPTGFAPPILPPAPPGAPKVGSSIPADPSLGSFRAGVEPGRDRPSRAFDLVGEPPLFPAPPRPKRPDVRKLGSKSRS